MRKRIVALAAFVASLVLTAGVASAGPIMGC